MPEPLRNCPICGGPIYKKTKKFCKSSHQTLDYRRRHGQREATYPRDEPLTKTTTLLLVVMAIEAAVTIWIVTGAQGPV